MRLIDADHLRRWILSRVFKTQLSVADVIDQIDREDTIEPERKRGKWIDDEGNAVTYKYCATCSACGEWSEYLTAYCPNCGAKMEDTP